MKADRETLIVLACLAGLIFLGFMLTQMGQASSSKNAMPLMTPDKAMIKAFDAQMNKSAKSTTLITPLMAIPPSVSYLNLLNQIHSNVVPNQGTCGSCWDFASTACIEIDLAKTRGIQAYLSRELILDCFYPTTGKTPCCGGNPYYFCNYYNSRKYFALNSEVPYTSKSLQCSQQGACTASAKTKYNITAISFVDIPVRTVSHDQAVQNIKDVLASGHGVYLVIWEDLTMNNADVAYWRYKTESDVLTLPAATGPAYGGHAMVLVGYDDSKRAFLVQNSYGTTSNRPNGLYLLSYDTNWAQKTTEGYWCFGAQYYNVAWGQMPPVPVPPIPTPLSPITITNSVTIRATNTTATVGGILGGQSGYVYLKYGTMDGGNGYWQNTKYLGKKPIGSFTWTLTGLRENTTYYYTSYAQNGTSIAWASPSKNFRTQIYKCICGLRQY